MARDAPIGAGHAAGMARQGLRELRGAMYAESNIAQVTDMGIVGNATPGEVAEARRPDEDLIRDQNSPGLSDRLQEANSRERPDDSRSRGMEKD